MYQENNLGVKPAVGLMIGQWTILSPAPKRGKQKMWNCRCRCGAVHVVYERSLYNRKSLRCRKCIPRRISHGKTHTKLYRVWVAMRSRCTDARCPNYKNYGARGIGVCDSWMKSFSAFSNDMGERPAGMTLDRINNDGDYEPGNCRWLSYADQAVNKRHSKTLRNLSDADALELIQIHKMYGVSGLKVCKEYNVTPSIIYRIVNGESRKHLQK